MTFVTSPLYASGMLDKENFYSMLADNSGKVYVGKTISEKVLTDPRQAVQDGLLKEVAILKKVMTEDGEITIRPMPIADLSADHFRLFEKVTRTINKALEKSTGLMDIMPYVSSEQLEDFAEVAINKTSPVTGYTPEMAKVMAKQQIEHSKKAVAFNMLSSFGYKPNMKLLQDSNPVQVSSEFLAKEEENNNPLIEAESVTIDV